MHKIVLLRHGDSTWNKEDRFTGWTDVDLSGKGREEAVEAGRVLLRQGFVFDVAFTSVLRRAIKTLWVGASARFAGREAFRQEKIKEYAPNGGNIIEGKKK